jgi:hypothetical protein
MEKGAHVPMVWFWPVYFKGANAQAQSLKR